MAREDDAAERVGERDGGGLTRRETLRRGGALGVGGLGVTVAGTERGATVAGDGAPAVEWVRAYGTDSQSVTWVADVARAPEGGYLFVGGEYPAFAMSVDDDGCRRLVRTFEASSGTTVLPTDEGGFVVGLINVDGPHLARVGPSRDVEWTVSFFDEEAPDNDHTPNDVIPAADGGYVVVGESSFIDPGRWAAKIAADGRVVWNNYYGFCGVFVGVAPAPEDDDASYVVGEGYTGCESAAPTLRGLKEDGTIAWTTTYEPVFLDFQLAGFVRTADGGYAFAGTNYINGRTVVWKVRPDRSLEWRRAYYEKGNVSALVAMPEGGLAYACTPEYGWEVDPSVTRLSPAGDVQWRGTYLRDDRTWYVQTLLRAPDGGFVFGGTVGARTGARSDRSAYLTKLAPDSRDP